MGLRCPCPAARFRVFLLGKKILLGYTPLGSRLGQKVSAGSIPYGFRVRQQILTGFTAEGFRLGEKDPPSLRGEEWKLKPSILDSPPPQNASAGLLVETFLLGDLQS